MMVAKLIYKLCSHRRQKISLAVREGNTAAQMFFRGHRFQAARVLRGYYEDSGEDAFQMEYSRPTGMGRVRRQARSTGSPQFEENSDTADAECVMRNAVIEDRTRTHRTAGFS